MTSTSDGFSSDATATQQRSSMRGEEESPFFADITLDLAEAHDIAETPEPRKFVVDDTMRAARQMPQIPPFNANSSNHSVSGPPARMTLTSGGASVSSMEISDNTDDPMRSVMGSVAHAYDAPTPSLRRFPRDIPWAAAFCVIVPTCLLVPILVTKPRNSEDQVWIATASAPRLATLHTLLWGYVATLVLCRMLYRTMGGGDGDDARYSASQVLLAFAPISVSVYISLTVAIYLMTPSAWPFVVIPLWYLARDLYLFRRWKLTATTPGGRQAFFQALTCMTLDILSRSLRRQSFYRVVSGLLAVQLALCLLWRMAILGALHSRGQMLLIMAIFGGKWATGTVARLLSLIASGGISSWFAEQNILVQELQQTNQAKQSGEVHPLDGRVDHGEDVLDFNSNNSKDTIMEDYRTADASAYKSALVPDEGMDDDFEDEEDDTEALTNSRTLRISGPAKGSTVKTFLFSGLTISFGSVAQCGLLGGVGAIYLESATKDRYSKGDNRWIAGNGNRRGR